MGNGEIYGDFEMFIKLEAEFHYYLSKAKKRGAEKWDNGEKNGVVSCGKNPGGS